MVWLIRREWKRGWRHLWLPLFLQMLILLIPGVLYLVMREQINTWITKIYELPVEVYALLGIQEWGAGWDAGRCQMFIMMFLNVWIAWSACMRMLRGVYMDEDNGTIYSLCNQMYSRSQLGLSKLLWGTLSFLSAYLILSLELMVLIGIGNQKAAIETDFAAIATQQMNVMLVVVMLMSLTFLYAACTRYIPDYTKYGFVICLVFGTWILGNIYKLRDLVFWIMQQLEISVGELHDKLLWLNVLRQYSPLSWINPYMQFEGNLPVFCVGVTLLAAVIGVAAYRRTIY